MTDYTPVFMHTLVFMRACKSRLELRSTDGSRLAAPRRGEARMFCVCRPRSAGGSAVSLERVAFEAELSHSAVSATIPPAYAQASARRWAPVST